LFGLAEQKMTAAGNVWTGIGGSRYLPTLRPLSFRIKKWIAASATLACANGVGNLIRISPPSFSTAGVVCLAIEDDDMEHSVKLARLPDKVEFPDRLRGRIHYDAAKGQLSYQGFMTKCTYDELAALDDDADYHRAIEHLFVLTSQEVAPQPRSRSIPVIVLATVATLLLAAVTVWTMMRQSHSPASGSMTVSSSAS
jgi:hypothetical protein